MIVSKWAKEWVDRIDEFALKHFKTDERSHDDWGKAWDHFIDNHPDLQDPGEPLPTDKFYPGPSEIHGTGVFCEHLCSKGDEVWFDFSVSDHETRFNTDMGSEVIIPDAPFCYLNHAWSATCELCEDPDGKPFLLFIRDVVFGEEITFDYGWEDE